MRGILEAIATALRPLFRRPVRTLLLLQGTVWGVAVAIFPSAVIEGTRQATLQRGAEVGADRMAIAADPTTLKPTPLLADDVGSLDAALRAADLSVGAVGGVRIVTTYELPEAGGTLAHATFRAPQSRGLSLAAGRWLRPDDPTDVCVAEAGVGAAVGDVLMVGVPEGAPLPLRVVGVTRPQSEPRRRTNDLGFDITHPLYHTVGKAMLHAVGVPFVQDDWKRSDRVVYAPLGAERELDWILVQVSPTDVKEAARVAETHLVERSRSAIVLHPLVLPVVVGGEIDRFQAVQTALFLACLCMGAIVMANLGLLTVLRRSREIAIRRVEGATRRTIAAQFLLEGVVLTAVGCAVGCVLGMGLAVLRVRLSPVTGFSWVFPWQHASIAVGVALVIGVLAALLPAVRAARRDPIAGLVEE